MTPIIAPWLKPVDFAGVAEAGARLGLSRQQMLQQAAEHSATLAAEGQRAAAEQDIANQKMQQQEQQMAAADALNAEKFKQGSLLGQERVDATNAATKQRGDAASAANLLHQQQLHQAAVDRENKFMQDYYQKEDKQTADEAKAKLKAPASPYSAWEKDQIFKSLMADPQNQTNLDVVLPKFRQYIGSGGANDAQVPTPAPAAAALAPQPDTSGLPDFTGVPTQSASPADSNGVRVREKATGKVFTYGGNAADVPTNTYDVLQ